MSHSSTLTSILPVHASGNRRALGGLYLAMLMSSLDTSITHTALPSLMRALSASFAQVQWIVLAYLITLTALAALAGRIGDRFGRRRALVAGLAVFVIASVLCALAPGVHWLIAARALQGAGAAVMMALTVAFVADLVPGPRRGRAMGLVATTSAFGTTMGPTLGGILTNACGWQAIFLINVPLGALALFMLVRFLPADAMAEAMPRPRSTLLSLCRTPGVGSGLLMLALVATVIMATMVVGPFYLTRALGYDVQEAGVLLSIGPLAAALAGLPAGSLVDRLGARNAVSVGLAGLALACVALVVLPVGVLFYLAPVACMTSCYSLFQAANSTRIMEAVDAASRGAAAGLLGQARNAGLIAGASLMGAVFAAGWTGSVAAGPSAALVVDGMRTTFAVAAAMMIAALLLSRRAVLPARAAKA